MDKNLDFTIVIGGRAGDGIRQTGNLIARTLNQRGYHIFVNEDYPSLIRGGHNFSIIRCSTNPVQAIKENIDILIAMDEKTIQKHKNLNKNSVIIFDSSDETKQKGIGIKMKEYVSEKNYKPIMRNTVAYGTLCKILGIDLKLAKKMIEKIIGRHVKENIELVEYGYNQTKESFTKLDIIKKEKTAIITGNEAIALGAVKAGLENYYAYPMTPATSVLHYLAENQDKFGLEVYQPESELATVNMAIGSAFAGKRSMVGTADGGFALMTEALSLTGISETPLLFFVSQRAGPATGVPTYTSQGSLLFTVFAGAGDFQKIVVCPGDAEDSFEYTGKVLNLVWKYQIPGIVLADKELSENTYEFNLEILKTVKKDEIKLSTEKNYARYKFTDTGISPLLFPGKKDAVVRGTSYEHDEHGITTEDLRIVQKMQDKRAKKTESLINELKKTKTANIFGDKKSKTAIICFGSTKGICKEVGENLKLKVIQPIFIEPFPIWEIEKELKGIEKIIVVELNMTGQLSKILTQNEIKINKKILKYNSRPFVYEELHKLIKDVI